LRWNIQILQKKIFPAALFNVGDENIHLTFDDGPHPIATTIVLRELKKYNIKASFFLLGQNAQNFPDLVRKIHAEGHQICNHSFTHVNLFFKNKPFMRDEILRTAEIIETITGAHANYFRPPFGYFNWATMNVLHELGLTCVLWDVDSKDYMLNSVVDISNRVISNTTHGSILLFHDNDLTAQKAETYIPALLDTLLRNNFNFTALPK
jgi:peptidoglycan/xylan/chitin deacetylase (PgdA/CDA1 family)